MISVSCGILWQQNMEEISYSGSNSPIRRRVSKRIALFGVFFIIIIFLIGSVFYFVTHGNTQKKETKSITLPPTSEPEVSVTSIPTTKESPTPTTKLTPVPTKAPQSDSEKAGIKVAIQNGSGEAGVAGKASDILKKAGYNVVSTANAQNFDYKDVTIQVKAAKKGTLKLLEDDLSTNYTIGTKSSDLPADASYDALVIIGK